MSLTVMMAVAVLERPKFRLPSMSVACTIIVYWDTFCKGTNRIRASYLFAKDFHSVHFQCSNRLPLGKKKKTVL